MRATLLTFIRVLLPPWVHDRLIGRWDVKGFKRYTSNTLWALGARFANITVSLFVTLYLIRYLGPEHYGNLSYAISFVGLFSFLGSIGIDNILYRELVNHPEKKNVYLGSAFTLKLFAGLIATIVTIVVASFIATDDVSRLVIMVLAGTFIFNASSTIVFEFQANVEQKYTSIISFVVVCVLNTLKLVVIVLGEGILYIAFILLLEAVLYAILYAYIRIRRYGSILAWKYDSAVALSLVRDAWPFIFITVFAALYTRIDQVLLKHLVDSSAVGLYDAAVRIAEAWLFLPGIIASSLFPAILNAKKTNIKEYQHRVLTLVYLLAGLAIVVALPLSLLGTPIMLLLYGPAFVASGNVFSIYIWSGVLLSINYVMQYFLLAEHRHGTIFAIAFATMVVNIGLNLLLIPHFGIIGAASAMLLSYLILTLPLVLVLKTR